jgi:hypothetical protein
VVCFIKIEFLDNLGARNKYRCHILLQILMFMLKSIRADNYCTLENVYLEIAFCTVFPFVSVEWLRQGSPTTLAPFTNFTTLLPAPLDFFGRLLRVQGKCVVDG